VHSQNLVGYCYAEGLGVEKDPRMALYWYLAAADGKHIEAPFNLGLAYEHGTGTRVNLKKAFAFYKQAASL
jgi:TPR repeat protein